MIKIYDYDKISIDDVFERQIEDTSKITEIVTEIIDNVRKNGDDALRFYADKFDGGAPECLEVSKEEFDAAMEEVSPELIEILKKAKENIEDFHKRQIRQSFVISEKEGVVTGQKIIPVEKAGLYVPGGTASYPSSVLMNSVPAKLAGVKEIVITTPAKAGKINPVILAAARIGGVDRVFKTGGAQAIAALAYGTQTIPRVDKIVGPGNAFVAEAKKQVYGRVSIDMIAGPSEILVIADGKSSPAFVAADMLSQAEHDKMASAVLVTESRDLAEKVSAELEKQIPQLMRAEIARESIDRNGKIIIVKDIKTAVEASNEIAPEHLELCIDNPFDYLDSIKNAGSIFMGRYCPEALGDYFAGPNHVLPTSGTARFFSPLSVDSFVKKSSFIYYTEDALRECKDKVVSLAETEGLTAHANSIKVRFED